MGHVLVALGVELHELRDELIWKEHEVGLVGVKEHADEIITDEGLELFQVHVTGQLHALLREMRVEGQVNHRLH